MADVSRHMKSYEGSSQHKEVTAEEREVKLDALFRRKAWPFTCRPRMCRSLGVFLIYISSLTFLSHLAMPDMVQIT